MNQNHNQPPAEPPGFPDLSRVMFILLATIGLTFGVGLIGALLGASSWLFLLEALIILPALVFVIQQRLPFLTIFRIHPVNSKIIFASIILGVSFSVVIDGIDRLVQLVLPMPESLQQAMQEALKIQSVSDFIIIVFSAVFLASILEEMLFRGFVQVSFENHLDVTRAVMATAFLFAIIHLNPWGTIQFTLFGIILGVIAWKSNSIIPPVIVHLINNAIALTFTNLPQQNIQWYLQNDFINPAILIVAIAATFWGMKLFYEYND